MVSFYGAFLSRSFDFILVCIFLCGLHSLLLDYGVRLNKQKKKGKHFSSLSSLPRPHLCHVSFASSCSSGIIFLLCDVFRFAHSRIALGIETTLSLSACVPLASPLGKVALFVLFCVQANDVGANQRRVSPTLPFQASSFSFTAQLNARERQPEKVEEKSGAAYQSLMKNRREHQRKRKKT